MKAVSNGLQRRSRLAFGLSVAAGLTLFGVRANAQDSYIFRGDPKAVSGITISGWGSGTVEEDINNHISGTLSYKIQTHGQFQGASVKLGKPVNLGGYVNNKNAFLQFTVKVIENGAGSKTGSKAGGLLGGGPPGGFPGGGGPPGGFPGGGGAGGAGGQQSSKKTQYQDAKEIQNVRIQLVNTQGQASEMLFPLDQAGESTGWSVLSVPISSIPNIKADNAEINEIRIFGDAPGTMYLGQARIAIDATPITVERIEDKPALPRANSYTYRVKATAGILPLKVSWDFDESDGIQEEKEGRAIKHSFYKSGIFVVTVTVKDVYGLRTPVVRTFKVNVTP